MNGDQQQASGTALLAIVNRRAILGAGARPSRVTAWPFVKSARLLSAEGHPADAVIEMWRPNTEATSNPSSTVRAERLVRSGARFAAKAMVLSAASNEAAIEIGVRRIGPALVFERLWEETGCRAVITALAGQRKHGFALERALFLTVLHRLFMSGSDRAADRWREDYAIVGVAGLDLHHLYRAMAWLGEELPEKEQDGRMPFAPRCLKDAWQHYNRAHRARAVGPRFRVSG